MDTNLKEKKVLITSGPTWVPIDNVRVISNTATGETGILLAKKFMQQGSKVTLLLGPAGVARLDSKIKLKRFSFFNELNILLRKELQKNYDIVIQAAAISDFAPKPSCNKKISSKCKTLKLVLKPTVKIINCLRKIKPNAFLVGFKFEPDAGKNRLIKKGNRLLKQANLDLVVANSNKNKAYQAYILDGTDKYGPFLNKTAMAVCLSRIIKKRL